MEGGRVRANVLGHVPFTNQSNESFLLCVWDQLYLQPLQCVTEVIKCLQQEHMMSHAMDLHIPPGSSVLSLIPRRGLGTRQAVSLASSPGGAWGRGKQCP